MRRKLFYLSLSMIFGIWIAAMEWKLAAGTVPAAFMFLIWISSKKRGAGQVLDKLNATSVLAVLIVLFYLSGVLVSFLAEFKYQSVINTYHGKGRVTGRVVEIKKYEDSVSYVIVPLSFETGGQKKEVESGWKIRVSRYGESSDEIEYRDIVSFYGELEVPDGQSNPRCYDRRSDLRSRGVYLTSRATVIRRLRRSDGPVDLIIRSIIRAREGFIGSSGLDDASKGLIKGILFGDTGEMDEDIYEGFRKNGIAHVLAVSGLHIGILYGLILKLFGKKRRVSRLIASLIILSIYGTLALWSPSVTRAVLLILYMESGDLLERRADITTGVSLISLIVLFFSPFTLFRVSFIMSYLAICSMAFISGALERYVSPGAAKAIGIQAGLMPYIAYEFNYISAGAILLNIPVIALVSVLLPLGLISFSCFTLHEASGIGVFTLISFASDKLIEILSGTLTMISESASSLPFISFDCVSPPAFILVLIYAVLFISCSETLVIAAHRKDVSHLGAALIFSALLVIITIPVSFSLFDKADIVMIDVGQGDAMHFRYDTNGMIPGGKRDVLIDGGGSENYNIGKNVLRPYLLKNGAGYVEMAYATHLHTDHYKGLEELTEEGLVKELLTKGRTGDVIWLGKEKDKDNCIEIIYPDSRDPDTDVENKNSLIFKAHIKGVTCLVTGDLGEEGEKALMEKYNGTETLDSDILKVCHHGSKYSSSTEFLRAVSPEVALIGVGKNNMYGHPAEEVIERLESEGAKVFRTDRDGAIGITIKGNGVLRICANSKE